MYPFGRMMKEMFLQRRALRIGLLDLHRSWHRCWPWDLDPWMELNNGRTLTLYDLGRVPSMLRTGLVDLLKKAGCGITVAGATVRYRQRIRVFERVEMRTRVLGWDDRFFYMEQGIWSQGRCANHILLRLAAFRDKAGVGKPGGIIPPAELLTYWGECTEVHAPKLPEWVERWIESEAQRLWPPEIR